MASGLSPPSKKRKTSEDESNMAETPRAPSSLSQLQESQPDSEQKVDLLTFLGFMADGQTPPNQSDQSNKESHLTVDNVFNELVKIAKGWRWVAEEILLISSSKCDEIAMSNTTEEVCLKEAIEFWIKRYVFSSWDFLIYRLNEKDEGAVLMKMSAKSRTETRLTVNNVLNVLVKVTKGWRWVAENVLLISSSKCNEFVNDDERICLKQAIEFWIKRCVFASWRFLIYWLNGKGEDEVQKEMIHLAEPITDSTMTVSNILSAVESVSNEDFAEAIDVPADDPQLQLLKGSGDKYKEILITEGLKVHPAPTWDFLSGKLHMYEHTTAAEKVKKYIKRDIDPSVTHENLMSVLKDVKDWSSDTHGFPWCIDIPTSERKRIENMHKHSDSFQLKSAFIEHWLKTFPYPCWERICYALYWQHEYDVLEKVQAKYFVGTYEARRHFEIAMKRGKTKTNIAKVVLFGAVGSGKTCTKQVILNEDPPQEHTSTPLAIRPAKVYCINTLDSHWMNLNQYQRDLLIAGACHLQGIRELAGLPRVLPTYIRGTKTLYVLHHSKNPIPSVRSPDHVTESTFADGSSIPKKVILSSAPVSSLDIHQYILECMADMPKDMTVELKRVQISDCGGQPQFHEVLPIFLRGPTLYLFVFKLNETLSTRPEVNFYRNGNPLSVSYTSFESVEQLLEHCLRVVRSQKARARNEVTSMQVGLNEAKHSQDTENKVSEFPKIMIIGTHKDKENECQTETREDKNEKLANLLFPEFEDDIEYFCADTNQLICPLNAKMPGADEKRLAGKIRHCVSSKCSIKAEIPLQYHALEVLLEKLAGTLKRDVLSKADCFAAARNLHFDSEAAFDAALDYLDRLNLVFYYPEILPDVVFVSSQILLDKVSDLVIAHVRKEKTAFEKSTLPDGLWRRFHKYALVSADLLAEEEFQDHYIPGLFDHHDLILLFRRRLIFADYSGTEYFVPALLKRLKSEELDQHRSSPLSVASPLVLSFVEHGGPLIGVFCASVVALLSEDNIYPRPWVLSKEQKYKTPSCLYRNCVEFEIPDQSNFITMIETFEYIEVHIDAQSAACSDDEDLHNDCPKIRESIMKALKKATTALHYEFSEPKIGFGCPCGESIFHQATISDNGKRWICTKNTRKYGKLKSNQAVWLYDSKISLKPIQLPTTESVPKWHELHYIESQGKQIKIFDRVAAEWEQVAARLHFESHTIRAIKVDSCYQTDPACRSMFDRWLQGNGRMPTTWQTLITALNEAEFSSLAKEIQQIII